MFQIYYEVFSADQPEIVIGRLVLNAVQAVTALARNTVADIHVSRQVRQVQKVHALVTLNARWLSAAHIIQGVPSISAEIMDKTFIMPN